MPLINKTKFYAREINIYKFCKVFLPKCAVRSLQILTFKRFNFTQQILKLLSFHLGTELSLRTTVRLTSSMHTVSAQSTVSSLHSPVWSAQVRSSVHDWWIILFCGVSKRHHFFFLHLVHILMTYLCCHDFLQKTAPAHPPLLTCYRVSITNATAPKKSKLIRQEATRLGETQRWRDDDG